MRVVRGGYGHAGQMEERKGFEQTHPWACLVLMKEIWIKGMHRTDASSYITTCKCKHYYIHTRGIVSM